METVENVKGKSESPISPFIAESIFYPGIGEIHRRDLDCENSAGFIIHAPFGTLIHFKDEVLRLLGGRGLIFYTISAKPLYVVNGNDLSEEKKKHVGVRP